MTFYDCMLCFFLYGFLGWCTEVGFAAVKQRRFVNRGFLNGPICPIYGVGVTLVILLLTPFSQNLFFFYLFSVIVVTLLEGATGWAMDKIFHNKWWDYSHMPLNLGGYVCLLFSMIWGAACVVIVYFLHPLVYKGLSFLPRPLGIILIVILSAALLADIIVTASAIFRFNKSLAHLRKITDELHEISDQLGEDIFESVMRALEKQEQSRLKLDVSEEMRSRISELKSHIQDIAGKTPKTARRLLRAFPHLESRKYKEQLDLFQKKWSRSKKKSDASRN